MCDRVGVMQAFSQAHRPQGSGRAEVACKQLITLLRKMHADNGANWVEALPRAIRMPDSLSNCLWARAQSSRTTPVCDVRV